MGINEQIDSLRKRVQGTPPKDEDERLLQLYWNRVELKKEFSRLQEDNFNLQQQLKKQGSTHQQSIERLQTLEEFLGDPDNGNTALVYYQLRALWARATGCLADLCKELTEQQRERERKLQQIEFDQNRQRRLGELEKSILDGRSQVESLDGHIQLLRRQITGLRWFWHGKKRRELQSQLEPLEQQQEKSSAELVALEEQRESLASAILPDISGMSIEGKRLINTAMLAYAQQLLMRLGEDGLALMAKDANLKRVGDVRYGSSEECQQWLQKLQLALRDLHDRPRQLGNLKLHIQRLRANAFYRSDHETVPVPESIGAVSVRTRSMMTDSLSAQGGEDVNVLLDDYWDLYAILLH